MFKACLSRLIFQLNHEQVQLRLNIKQELSGFVSPRRLHNSFALDGSYKQAKCIGNMGGQPVLTIGFLNKKYVS
jgi:hypothetical protein